MHRCLTFLFALAISVAAIAQGHKTFLGIPLDGSLPAFTKKLEQKGFRFVRENTSKCYEFRGKYLGKERRLAVFANYNDKVYKVKIVLPDYDFEALLKGYIDLYEKNGEHWYEWEEAIESYSFCSDDGNVNLYNENGITYLEFEDWENNPENQY